MSSSNQITCAECGMVVWADEYHPFAACLMFKQCHNSETVRTSLAAVRDQGRKEALQEVYGYE